MEPLRLGKKLLPGNILDKHNKLIAADTEAGIHPELRPEALRKACYELISELVTLCVVREFQTVHIGEDCRQNTAVLLKIPAEIVIAEPAVQSGQRVVVAEILQRLLAGSMYTQRYCPS